MSNNNILFDDWQTRYEGALNYRRRVYIFSLICTGFLFLASIVAMFFDWSFVVLFVLAVIVLTTLMLEWLKVKNNHLIIKNNQIEITNRFNKTTIYEMHIEELVIELRHSYNRKGGIVMKFYDANNHLICKYEDMLNAAALLGEKRTNWERSIEALGVKIIDAQWIIKNESMDKF